MLPILVQVRLKSSRLPYKALYPVNGKPLIRYMYERLLKCRNSDFIKFICPKVDEEIIAAADVPVWGCNGPEWDVYHRYVGAYAELKLHRYPALVRICADSPLIDPIVVDAVIAEWARIWSDLRSREFYGKLMLMASNTKPQTWPSGQCVEVFSSSLMTYAPIFERDANRPISTFDLEHVTPAMYRVMDDSVHSVRCHEGDYSHERYKMTVDTIGDYLRIKRMIEGMDRDHTEYGWKECLGLPS